MSITAKELAQKLGLSQTAVSMALNNKPGVSTKTRNEIIRAAEQYGYDFSRIKKSDAAVGTVYVIFYKTHNAILSYTPIFDELWEGMQSEFKNKNYPARVIQFYEKTDDLENCFADLRGSDCCGIILVGTEIHIDVCRRFQALGYPMVLLDSFFDNFDCTSVIINNQQGAYMAADYLISRYQCQPGYLRSAYSISNFVERAQGFYKAIKENGMSTARIISHSLSVTIENAMADMLEIIDSGTPLARCYFADNDILAIGAMKAFKLRGYKIPEDIAIVGFDNISEGRIIEPSLTTMDVPRYFLGQTAAQQLLREITTKVLYTSKIEVSARMYKRFSA